ncbi:hypothetical protein [Novipirellula artificiosorum]|uniref:Uncharacterized protein n=1 Tax=Novipirellula artificiosorum TaxID=2528016 RepID=A0A5C6DLN1_9BACT|nr:hypothetical protein [Novipirellula artificiosorum]TWU37034.1 hypothetical protein Poly41_31600 [Novipirellula artificiosorum]
MAKRSDLLRRLKMADRRRNRRPTAAAKPAQGRTAAPTPQTDVAGLVVTEILQFVDEGGRRSDAEVVSALRAFRRGSNPSSPDAMVLKQRLQQIGDRADVEMRTLRDAVGDLIDEATHYSDRGQANDRFVKYLQLVAGS